MGGTARSEAEGTEGVFEEEASRDGQGEDGHGLCKWRPKTTIESGLKITWRLTERAWIVKKF
jgi:hypothetical protein